MAVLSYPSVLAALAFAMCGAMVPAQAQQPAEQSGLPGQNFVDLEQATRRISNWRDSRYARGWSVYCANNPERGGCETVLRRYGHRPVVGVVLAPDQARGVRVAGVTPDGPAARAGIRAGDRLLGINGRPIEGSDAEARVESARRALLGFKSKDTVELMYERDDRSAAVNVKPKIDARLMILANDGHLLRPDANVLVRRDRQGRVDVEADGLGLQLIDGSTPIDEVPVDGQGNAVLIAGVSPTRSLLIDPDCGEAGECSPLRLSDAFRWNGFNLAAVDPQLGRYFGASEGVLVLSSSPLLPELQSGDVIRSIDGVLVTTPRAVMDLLRGKPAQSTVQFELLRDRRETSARVQLPEALAVAPAFPDQSETDGQRPPQPQAPKTGSRIRR